MNAKSFAAIGIIGALFVGNAWLIFKPELHDAPSVAIEKERAARDAFMRDAETCRIVGVIAAASNESRMDGIPRETLESRVRFKANGIHEIETLGIGAVRYVYDVAPSTPEIAQRAVESLCRNGTLVQ